MGWYHGQVADGENPFEDAANAASSPNTIKKLGKIYHLCQKNNWMEAVESGQPYFPPSFISDGRFTRASEDKSTLADTANHFYKETKGEWICLELNAPKLLQLGLQILPQCAPEGTADKPVNCLQIFGGIATSTPGIVNAIFPMIRLGDGTFYSIGEPCSKIPKGAYAPAKEQAQASCATNKNVISTGKVETKTTKRRGLFGRKK